MDHMDLDQLVDVPDTPDRLAAQNITVLRVSEKQNIPFKFRPSGKCKLFDEESKNQPVSSGGNVSVGQTHPPRCITRSGNQGKHVHSMSFGPGVSSPSGNSNLFRIKAAEKGSSYENKHSDFPNVRTIKASFTSQSSTARDRAVINLTEDNGHVPVLMKDCQSGVAGITQPDEFKEASVLADSCSNLSRASYLHKLNDVNEGKTSEVDDKGGANPDFVHHADSKTIARSSDCVILDGALPRGLRQKRLVRNGCISPLNIAKGKQPVENAVRDTAGEYNPHSRKGKGVLNQPLSMNESDVRCTHKSSRNSLRVNEKACDLGDASGDAGLKSEESHGWRTTRSQTRNQPRSNGAVGSFLDHGCNGSKVTNKETEDNVGTVHLIPDSPISDASARPARQISFHLGPQFCEPGGRYLSKDAIAKRQKQGYSGSTSAAECSSSATNSPNHTDLRIEGSVINVGEGTPEVPHVSSSAIGCSGSYEDDTVSQVELDELLARELQEQFYNEDSAVRMGEIDAHIARSLLQQEEPIRTVTRGGSNGPNPRQLPYHNLPRAGAHASTSSRMTRLRNRFPGQPRSLVPSRGRNSTMLPSRRRNSIFPEEMDIDMRMNILEALESLEAFSDGSSYLQMQQDFTENDYEMLLALDENNHQHTGATDRQINGLPQSTVQSDNLEEACAICLENPANGDIIRHLPCLHKFHKDCIDPWLRRKTSCPVCKSSVT